MDVAYFELEKHISNLNVYINNILIRNKILKKSFKLPTNNETESDILSYRKNIDHLVEKTYEYSSITISLYSVIEQFIENTVAEHLRKVSHHVNTPSELNDNILKKHTELSINLLGKLNHQKYRDTLTDRGIIKNLHYVISNKEKFDINIEAFTHHDANFREDQINKIFRSIGIDNIIDRAKKHPIYIQAISDWKINHPTEDDNELIIDDIAERRNDIAHSQPDNLLTLERLLAYADYVAIIGNAISHIMMSEFVFLFCSEENLITVGKPIEIYNNRIVCFEIDNSHISIDDFLVVMNAESKRHINNIKSLHCDKEPVNTVSKSGRFTVCVECVHNVKMEDDIYILHNEIINP